MNSKLISTVFYTVDLKSRGRFWRIPGKSEKDNFRQEDDYTEADKLIILIIMREKVCIPGNNLLLNFLSGGFCRGSSREMGGRKVLRIKKI